MVDQYFNNYITLLIFLITGLAFVPFVVTLNRLVSPRNPRPEKLIPYECGMNPIGDRWSNVHVRYYIYALLFLIFDVEIVFIFPWAVYFKELGLFGFIEMMTFIAILVLGLIYAWKKGVLKWV
ncbi:MAG: NADH-quinone oxidoreductase subunit A [Omnitrophica WOR_2 bacterium RBG_13_44_8]|nr:MAG: NADH-quinone oxidoreductase subunit A [Omnitrophica WOR_2 bacterium RBG_13_44_8]